MASLNRKEWEEMWESVKEIEKNVLALTSTNKLRGNKIYNEVIYLKRLIQSVIGQME